MTVEVYKNYSDLEFVLAQFAGSILLFLGEARSVIGEQIRYNALGALGTMKALSFYMDVKINSNLKTKDANPYIQQHHFLLLTGYTLLLTEHC